MKITIPINPVPGSRPRVTRYGTYYGKRHRQFVKDVQQLYDSNVVQAPSEVLQGVFMVDTTYYCKMPKMSLKKALSVDGSYCGKKMDLDNLQKITQDEIVSRYIEDDCFIVESSCRKFWSKDPRIEIIIKQI